MARKSGPFTSEEIAYIRQKSDSQTAKEIADYLERNPTTVANYLAQIDSLGGKAEILNLKKRHDWKVLQKQLSPDELETFEWHWNNIVKQFRDEIYHTEGMQVINGIKHEIIANRMLTDQRKIAMQVNDLEEKLHEEYKGTPPDYQRIELLEKQISMLSAVQEVNNKEYRENSKKLSEILVTLKATREQRVAKNEDIKKNFTLWMNRLQFDPSIKKELGEYMEKMRLALYVELERLGKPFRYMNGEVDRPILNSETIDFEEDEDTDA